MPRTGQPALHDAVHRLLTRRNVLRSQMVRIARCGDALCKRAPILAGVREIVVGGHVLRMPRGGREQAVVPREGRHRGHRRGATGARRGASGVDLLEQACDALLVELKGRL